VQCGHGIVLSIRFRCRKRGEIERRIFKRKAYPEADIVRGAMLEHKDEEQKKKFRSLHVHPKQRIPINNVLKYNTITDILTSK
jgi:hypothetical protein